MDGLPHYCTEDSKKRKKCLFYNNEVTVSTSFIPGEKFTVNRDNFNILIDRLRQVDGFQSLPDLDLLAEYGICIPSLISQTSFDVNQYYSMVRHDPLENNGMFSQCTLQELDNSPSLTVGFLQEMHEGMKEALRIKRFRDKQ
jgi:hypothetical protein